MTTINFVKANRLATGFQTRRTGFGTLLLLTALATTAAFAGPKPQMDPLSLYQAKCVTSGTGDQYMRACWSEHGNLISFESPQGVEQLSGAEGYALCYGDLIVPQVAYEIGSVENGFGPSTVSSNKMVVTRDTADGRLRLKQTFTRNGPEKEITVKMEIKNISGSPVKLQGLSRYFDGDLDNTTSSDVYDRTAHSVTGRQTNGLSLTSLSGVAQTSVHTFGSWQVNVCSQASAPTPTAGGDWVGRVNIPIGLNLAPNATETVTFVYRSY